MDTNLIIRKKKISYLRNNGYIYQNFNDLETKVLFDDGTSFISKNNLGDGETVIFRYYEQGNIASLYATVANFNNIKKLSILKNIENSLILKEKSEVNINNIEIVNTISNIKSNLNVDKFIIIPDNSSGIFFNKTEINGVKNIFINGPKYESPLYYGEGGILLNERNNYFSVLPALINQIGGIKTSSLVINKTGLTECPIINGKIYYGKLDKSYGSGNDFKRRNVTCNSSGWYRIAYTSHDSNNHNLVKSNYCIFTVTARFKHTDRNEEVYSSSVTFICSYNNKTNSNDGVSISILSSNNTTPNNNLNNGNVIKSIMITYPKTDVNNSEIAYINIFINDKANKNCTITLDGSNNNGWNPNFNDNATITPFSTNETIMFTDLFLKKVVIKENAVNYNSFYKNTYDNTEKLVLNESNIATTEKGGVIKIKNNSVTNLEKAFIQLDSNKRAYVKVSITGGYVLPAANNNELGGIKLSSNNIDVENIRYNKVFSERNPNVNLNRVFSNIDFATTTTKGVIKLGANKINRITPPKATSGKYYPISVDNSNRGFLKLNVPTIKESTRLKLGGIKLGNSKVNINTPSVSNSGEYYPVVLDKNGKGCVAIPRNSSSYQLMPANSTTLGGIKLGSNTTVDSTRIMHFDENGIKLPIILDNSNRAFVSIPNKYFRFESKYPFIASLENSSDILAMFEMGLTSYDGTPIIDFEEFILYDMSGEYVILTEYINAITDFIPKEQPISMDIYTGGNIAIREKFPSDSYIIHLDKYCGYNLPGIVTFQNLMNDMESDMWERNVNSNVMTKIHIQRNIMTNTEPSVTMPDQSQKFVVIIKQI